MAKTRTALNTQIDNTVFSNTEGLIDAQKENTLLKDMVDSSVNKQTDAPLDDKYYGLKNQSVVELPLDDYQLVSDMSNYLTVENVDAVQQSGDRMDSFSVDGNILSIPATVSLPMELEGNDLDGYIADLRICFTKITDNTTDNDYNGIYKMIGYDLDVDETNVTLTFERISNFQPDKIYKSAFSLGAQTYTKNIKSYQSLTEYKAGTFYTLIS